MFSGIIEGQSKVLKIVEDGTNKIFTLQNNFPKEELYIDQSIAHNGVCLTVIEITDSSYVVEAILETLKRSNLNAVKENDIVNIERCVTASTRMDGHIVQGHVDCMATCTRVEDLNGSWEYTFQFPEEYTKLVIEKGSITINGISLTVSTIKDNNVSVSIIPYTWEHTNLNKVVNGSPVNVEFDMMGKYVVKYMENIHKK